VEKEKCAIPGREALRSAGGSISAPVQWKAESSRYMFRVELVAAGHLAVNGRHAAEQMHVVDLFTISILSVFININNILMVGAICKEQKRNFFP